MTTATDDGYDYGIEAGHVALLGHRLLGSVAVVTGALATLREGNGTVPADQQAVLEEQVERNLASISEIARTLVYGAADEDERPELCAQCYGRGTVRIDGKALACTCVSWPSSMKFSDGQAEQRSRRRPEINGQRA